MDVAAVAEHFAAAGEDGDGVAKDALAETRDEALHRHRLLLGEPRGGGEDQDERVGAAAIAEGIDAGAGAVRVTVGVVRGVRLAAEEGADVAEVVLEESAAVARARGIDDAELGGGSRDGRAGGDSVAGKDGRVVLVEGSDVHLATLRHGGEGSLRHEGVATEEGVAGGALAVAGLAHQHDRELLGGGHGDTQGCDALERARATAGVHICAPPPTTRFPRVGGAPKPPGFPRGLR